MKPQTTADFYRFIVLGVVMDAARCANSPDDELLRAVSFGDQIAFAEIYDRYALQTFERVLVEGFDRSLAETVVLGIFLDLWRQAPRIIPGPRSMAVWFSHNSHPIQANPASAE
jgi:hypothetical protein